MATDIFQRHEIKFMTDSRQRALLEQAFAGRMVPDSHGESTICNVYYDTPDYRLVRTSMQKPVYKEKLRMRSYGRVGAEDEVFLELKKKYKGVVYKRRIALTEREARLYMEGRIELPQDSQIGREIDYFRRFYRGIGPAAYLCYDRCAWYAVDDHDLRLTFDKNICWRDTDMRLTARTGGEQLLLPRQSLLEVKTAGAIPLWLVEALDRAEVRPASFSKYGEAYKIMHERMNTERRGVSCA